MHAWVARSYKPTKVGKFVQYLKNGYTPNRAAQKATIARTTAYGYAKMLRENPGVIPMYKPRSEIISTELSTVQKLLLIDYVEEFGPYVVLKKAVDALTEKHKG